MVHRDATLRLFAPDDDLGGIRARKRRRARRWFGPGECQRLVLEVLRDAGGPLSDQCVTTAVAVRKGLQDPPEVLAPLQKTALAVLRRLTGKGAARRVGLADGTRAWEASVGFGLEPCVEHGTVRCYARNHGLGLVIPYEYMGVAHNYESDFLVWLEVPDSDFALALEVKGFEDNQTKAKHGPAKRWVSAVNNWGKLGRWMLHVCRDPAMLEREIEHLCEVAQAPVRARGD